MKKETLTLIIKSLRILLCAGTIGIALTFLAAYIFPLPDRLSVPYSKIVEYNDSSPAYVFLSDDDKWRLPVSMDNIDPDYVEALIRFEDKRFSYHFGVDPVAVVRAMYKNLINGRIVSGASTITMQLVRILKPKPRTLRSKIIEAMQAVQLEIRFSKAEILQYYLQFIPFGKNIEGVESAAYAFFGHNAGALSKAEIAYLISVPQKPGRRYPSSKNKNEISQAIDYVCQKLYAAEYFSDKDIREVKKYPLPQKLYPYPRNSPHAANWLSQLFPNNQVLKTTLKKNVQQIAENILKSYKHTFSPHGIYNASVVVIDNKTSDVLALVGNIDFWDNKHSGQVPGFAAPRSPGSALKPFIYTMAIDKAISLPSQLVPDIPVRYGSYEPNNYDMQFNGLIKLEDALSKSLNVPFVNLLADIGVEPFLSFLSDCGMTTLTIEPGFYGLSIAIGGIEVSLLDLTNLYTIYARQGKYLDYNVLQNTENTSSIPVFSSAGTYLTKQALRIKDRPDFPRRRRVVAIPPDIYWKTGTSYGHRDAWAIGANPDYTVGVWVGNFDGTPSRSLVGSDRAGPVLFDILDALTNRTYKSRTPESMPFELSEVEVCAYSGYLPNSFCPDMKLFFAPVTNLPIKQCPFHMVYEIDVETGFYLPPLCRQGRNWKAEVFTVLPATIRRWISDNHLKAKQPPMQAPNCQQVVSQKPPSLVSPQSDTIFFIIPGIKPSDQEIPLEAEASGRESELSWFVNGKFLASSPPHKRVWFTPSAGKHKIRVVDSTGQFDQTEITIMTIN